MSVSPQSFTRAREKRSHRIPARYGDSNVIALDFKQTRTPHSEALKAKAKSELKAPKRAAAPDVDSAQSTPIKKERRSLNITIKTTNNESTVAPAQPAVQPAAHVTAAPVATPVAAKTISPAPMTPYGHPLPKLTANGKIRGRPRKCWTQPKPASAEAPVHHVPKPMSSTREELLRLREENANLKTQLEQKNNEFEELKRQTSYTGQTVPKIDYDDLKEKYQKDLVHAKRHEWCVVCLNPSRYHCCWNTTYCSQKCQVADWYSRHIKSCERRRALKSVS